MEESLVPSPPPGPVELCVGDCSADFRTQSQQLYSFVVRGLTSPFPFPIWGNVEWPLDQAGFYFLSRAASFSDPNI